MKIALLGDMAFFGKNSVATGTRVFEYFENVASYLSKFDHVIGNLETPLCEGVKPKGQKSAYINASPRNAELLKFLNVSVVNLANNHIFDYGPRGYAQTITALQESGIRYFGTEGLEVELVKASAKVAMHGYCSFNTNPLGVTRTSGLGLNILNIAKVRDRIHKHDKNGLLNIVSIHSGQEHVNYPSLDDIRMARLFATVCPYVYYGHHPHVMQGVESVNGSLIAYSLGNFCFDDVYTDKSTAPLIRQTDNNKTGLIVEIEVQGKKLVQHGVRTIFAGNESLHLEPEGSNEQLAHYSNGLADETQQYDSRRKTLISGYLDGRKELRDLTWYLKRLNLTSAGIILRAKLNQRQYKKNVSRYLESELAN